MDVTLLSTVLDERPTTTGEVAVPDPTGDPDGRRAGALVHRCRRCGGQVTPSVAGHAVAWCGSCRRVGVARVALLDR